MEPIQLVGVEGHHAVWGGGGAALLLDGLELL
jgi:hypothetical protein